MSTAESEATPLDVLFVCRHNASRSQMAEAFFRWLDGGRHAVASAGTMPGPAINPVAVEAMAELGLDLSQARPKPVTEELVARVRHIVLLGDHVRETAPPFLLATPHEEWELADPKGQGLAMVRGVRDALRPRVAALVQRLEQ